MTSRASRPAAPLIMIAAIVAACAHGASASARPAGKARRPRPPADKITTTERSVREIAPGVWVIRHPDAPDTFPQGNTTVIIGEREVLVVDACYLPSSAVEDIADIKKWTSKPVRWLVNTHWHYDHTMGNAAYRDAFPGLTIVAHDETRRQIAGYNPQWFENFPDRTRTFQTAIDSGKDANGRALSPTEIAEYRKALAGLEPVAREFGPLAARTDMAPDIGFSDELVIDLGGREVHLRHLGRGNTAGDAVVHLPGDKIVVAGDLVDHPVPYLSGGYPVDLVDTLDRLARLDIDTIVPGHGRLLEGKEGKAHLQQIAAFVREVVAAVSAEIHRAGAGPRKLDQVKAAVRAHVPVTAWRRRFAGDDTEAGEFFDGFALDGMITAAYAQLWSR